MLFRALLFLAPVLCLAAACGGEPDVAAPPPPGTARIHVAGTYRVTGTTVETRTGSEREISGLMILQQDSGRYHARYDLSTVYPSPEGSLDTDMIGSGEGSIEGGTLRGTAETQLVIGTIPGVDAGFALIPRTVGPRVVSTSVATLQPDGSILMEIQSKPKPGEDYAPTVTTLTGTRVAPEELAGAVSQAR